MATYQFGVTRTAGSYGLLQELSFVDKVKVNEAFDENGEVADYTDSDARIEVDASFIEDTDAADLESGDDITCGANKYHINEVTSREENQGYRKLTFKGVRYFENTLPA